MPMSGPTATGTAGWRRLFLAAFALKLAAIAPYVLTQRWPDGSFEWEVCQAIGGYLDRLCTWLLICAIVFGVLRKSFRGGRALWGVAAIGLLAVAELAGVIAVPSNHLPDSGTGPTPDFGAVFQAWWVPFRNGALALMCLAIPASPADAARVRLRLADASVSGLLALLIAALAIDWAGWLPTFFGYVTLIDGFELPLWILLAIRVWRYRCAPAGAASDVR